jgi:hypothetical protein
MHAAAYEPQRSIVTHLVPKSQHDSVIFTLIRHTCMPRPQISQHDVPLFATRLNRRPDPTPGLDHIGKNIADWFSYS